LAHGSNHPKIVDALLRSLDASATIPTAIKSLIVASMPLDILRFLDKAVCRFDNDADASAFIRRLFVLAVGKYDVGDTLVDYLLVLHTHLHVPVPRVPVSRLLPQRYYKFLCSLGFGCVDFFGQLLAMGYSVDADIRRFYLKRSSQNNRVVMHFLTASVPPYVTTAWKK
jgi:hypothetical protein